MPKAPSPYSLEFNRLAFGTWEADSHDYMEKCLERMEFYENPCHQVRILFGQKKLRYEISIPHLEGNRGRIDLDFDKITGIEFTTSPRQGRTGYEMKVQLSSPAKCYIGHSISEFPTSYGSEQFDFSDDGQIKSCRTHSFYTFAERSFNTMKKKLLECGLAAAIAAGINSTANFTTEEVLASFEKKKKKKSKKRPASENETNKAASSSRPRAAEPATRKPTPTMVDGLLQAPGPPPTCFGGPGLKK